MANTPNPFQGLISKNNAITKELEQQSVELPTAGTSSVLPGLNLEDVKTVHNESDAAGKTLKHKSTACMLLQDLNSEGTPLVLERFLEYMALKLATYKELFFIMAYIVALECGFVTQEDYVKCKDTLESISSTSTFNSKNVLNISLLTPTYKFATNKSYFQMNLYTIVNVQPTKELDKTLFSFFNGYVTGEFMVFTISPQNLGTSTGFSTCLSVDRYIIRGTEGKPLHQRFPRMDELTIMLREKLFVPARNLQIQRHGGFCHPSILGLPRETYDNIIQYLSDKDVRMFGKSNKYLKTITKDYTERKKKLKKATGSELSSSTMSIIIDDNSDDDEYEDNM